MADVEHNNFVTSRELSRLGSRERNFAQKLHNLALDRDLALDPILNSLRPSASSVFNCMGIFRIFSRVLACFADHSLSALFSAVQLYSALFSVKKNIFLFLESIGLGLNPSTRSVPFVL
jgi:hypothetical protein